MNFTVTYSEDGNEVRLVPEPSINAEDFFHLIKSFRKQGFRLQIPDDRGHAYRFVKKKPT